MKSHIRKIISKTIETVIVTEDPQRNPREQVYLLFTDGTHFELYWEWFTCSNQIEHGGETELLSLFEHSDRTQVVVYSSIGSDVRTSREKRNPISAGVSWW